MNDKQYNAAREIERFLEENKGYLNNKHGLIDFQPYLKHFADLHGVYTTGLKIPYLYTEEIIKKYYKKFVCTKVYPEGYVVTSLVQKDKFNHFIFDYLHTFKDQERQEGNITLVQVRVFSNAQPSCASSFMKKNKDLEYKIELQNSNFGFGGSDKIA